MNFIYKRHRCIYKIHRTRALDFYFYFIMCTCILFYLQLKLIAPTHLTNTKHYISHLRLSIYNVYKNTNILNWQGISMFSFFSFPLSLKYSNILFWEVTNIFRIHISFCTLGIFTMICFHFHKYIYSAWEKREFIFIKENIMHWIFYSIVFCQFISYNL